MRSLFENLYREVRKTTNKIGSEDKKLISNDEVTIIFKSISIARVILLIDYYLCI